MEIIITPFAAALDSFRLSQTALSVVTLPFSKSNAVWTYGFQRRVDAEAFQTAVTQLFPSSPRDGVKDLVRKAAAGATIERMYVFDREGGVALFFESVEQLLSASGDHGRDAQFRGPPPTRRARKPAAPSHPTSSKRF